MRIFQLTLALLIFSFSNPIIADVPSVDLLSADRLSQSVEGFGVLPKAKGDSLKQYLLISKERNPFAIRAKKEQSFLDLIHRLRNLRLGLFWKSYM